MRNTLKFSLLGILLCTISTVSNNGYSMEANEDKIDFNISVTNDKKEESDEELVNRINKILNIDPKNPVSILNQNRRYYDKYGNTMVQTNRYGLDKDTMIKKEDMNRYNMLMKKRNNYTNLLNSRSPFSTNYNYDYNYFNIDKSWTKTIRPQDTKFLDRIKKKLSDKEILKDEEIQRLKEIKDNNPDLISFMRYHSIRKYLESQTLKDNVNKPLNAIRKSEDKKEDEKEGTNNKFLERLRHDMAERIKIMYKKRKQKVNANHSSDKYKDESVKEKDFEIDKQQGMLMSGIQEKKSIKNLRPHFKKKERTKKKQQYESAKENQPSINVDENSSLKKQLDNLLQEKETDKILMEEKIRKAQEDNQKYREEINMLRNKLKESEELVKNLRRQSEQVNNNNSYDNQLGYYLSPSVVQNWYKK